VHTSAFLGAWNFDNIARKGQGLIAGRTIQEYQANGQLAEEECAQEFNAIYRLVQEYAPSNGTSRPDGTAHHANAYVGGVT